MVISVPVEAVEPVQCATVELLVSTVRALSLARDLDSVQRIVVQGARRLVRAQGATFVLRENEVCYYTEEEAIQPLWKGRRFAITDCVGGWTMLHRRPAIIEDVLHDPRVPKNAYMPTFVKSLTTVPIRPEDPIASLGVYWSDHHRSSPEEVRLLQALADSTAVAIENVRSYIELEERVRRRTAELETANQQLREEIQLRTEAERVVLWLMLTDELTGLYNRRGLLVASEELMAETRRQGRACLILFADLDGLKAINDTWGHQVGDQLLIKAAQALKHSVRDRDVVARLGGDEFVAVMTWDSGVTVAPDVVKERLVRQVTAVNDSGELPCHLSLSVGILVALPGEEDSLESLLNKADEAMYSNKQAKKASFATNGVKSY
jgi:diguanylate cyclase (GGDEF)-like protein